MTVLARFATPGPCVLRPLGCAMLLLGLARGSGRAPFTETGTATGRSRSPQGHRLEARFDDMEDAMAARASTTTSTWGRDGANLDFPSSASDSTAIWGARAVVLVTASADRWSAAVDELRQRQRQPERRGRAVALLFHRLRGRDADDCADGLYQVLPPPGWGRDRREPRDTSSVITTASSASRAAGSWDSWSRLQSRTACQPLLLPHARAVPVAPGRHHRPWQDEASTGEVAVFPSPTSRSRMARRSRTRIRF